MPAQAIKTADLIAKTVNHEEVFYQSAEFWVSVAFIFVVVLLFKPIVAAVSQMIHQRIERIKKEMQTAENIKLDAQKLYAEYEHKKLNAEKEVAEIVASEKAAIEDEKTRKMQAMEALLRQKNMEADARIEMAVERVNNEINTLIGKKTIQILTKIFLTKITHSEQSKLIDNSIKNLERVQINEP